MIGWKGKYISVRQKLVTLRKENTEMKVENQRLREKIKCREQE